MGSFLWVVFFIGIEIISSIRDKLRYSRILTKIKLAASPHIPMSPTRSVICSVYCSIMHSKTVSPLSALIALRTLSCLSDFSVLFSHSKLVFKKNHSHWNYFCNQRQVYRYLWILKISTWLPVCTYQRHLQDYCPTLTKGSKWQITQIWESDVFRLDL